MTKNCGPSEALLDLENQILDDLHEFLSGSYPVFDINSSLIQTKLEELARALIKSVSDNTEIDDSDDILDFHGDMDDFESLEDNTDED